MANMVKKHNRFYFYSALVVSVGIVILGVYDFIKHDLSTVELIMDILMLIVMIDTMIRIAKDK